MEIAISFLITVTAGVVCHYKRRIPQLWCNTVEGFRSLSRWTCYFLLPIRIIAYAKIFYNILSQIHITSIPYKRNILCQIIIMASPNEKKRYLHSTASLYALSTASLPASAETSIKSVDSGR